MEYLLVALTGCLLGLLTWRIQPQEAEKRKHWYQRRLRARLQILTTQQHILLGGTSYLIGRRRRKCDIPVGNGKKGTPGYDGYISREHAILSFDGTNWILRPVLRKGERLRLLLSGFNPSPELQYTDIRLGHDEGNGVLTFGQKIGPEGAVLRYGDVFEIGGAKLSLWDASGEEET